MGFEELAAHISKLDPSFRLPYRYVPQFGTMFCLSRFLWLTGSQNGEGQNWGYEHQNPVQQRPNVDQGVEVPPNKFEMVARVDGQV